MKNRSDSSTGFMKEAKRIAAKLGNSANQIPDMPPMGPSGHEVGIPMQDHVKTPKHGPAKKSGETPYSLKIAKGGK